MTQTSHSFWQQHYSGLTRPSGGRPSQMLTRFVEGRPMGRALDMGCARGDDVLWLAGQGWQVLGVDVSEAALEEGRKAAAKAGLSKRAIFEQHDFAVSFPKEEFDLISASYLHSPIEFGRVSALKRASQAITKGGLLLIVAHGSRAPWSWAAPDTVFPTAEEEFAHLELAPTDWRQIFVGPVERIARGPNDQTAKVSDTVVAIERL